MNSKLKALSDEAGMKPWGIGNDDNVSEIVELFGKLVIRQSCKFLNDCGCEFEAEQLEEFWGE